ncbi:MAG TPA: helix-turn-helix domain-containing protein [Rhodopila sp.]|nr:helix-turn-helix domain-containing protein [Rhodopila sp.]
MSYGSPAVFVLRLMQGQAIPDIVDGAIALARRGITLLRAKRAVEELVSTGRAFVDLPMVENAETLVTELAKAKIAAAPVEPAASLDVRSLRERLGLTREQFAIRYGLEVETVRNWEIGRREPDKTARSYLRAISNAPEQVEQAYAPTPAL